MDSHVCVPTYNGNREYFLQETVSFKHFYLIDSFVDVHENDLVHKWMIMSSSFLRTFARKFSNIDSFLQILPLKDDELVMSER